MSTLVRSAPLVIEGDAESIMNLTPEDCGHAVGLRHCKRPPHCDIPLYIGVFFDGTNNNRERDEPHRGHTNVVRLFNAHFSMTSENAAMHRQGHYAIYVSGLGTRFEPAGEWREAMEGKAMAAGGAARILFAVLEVVNAVHRAISNNIRLFEDAAITAKLHDYTRCVVEGIQTDSEVPSERARETRRAWMQRLNAELQTSMARAKYDRPRPHIPFIRVNVFGFSRGATQARAFCHWLDDLQQGGGLAGMPVEIGFLGLFESVASVGLSHSAHRVLGPAFAADGHFAWADEVLNKPLPAIVRRTVHFVAAHEQRLNFPLSRVHGENVDEIICPGVHSDVGGGYLPGTQGRSPGEALLVSQIPLCLMHRQARIWDVPLAEWFVMDERLRRDYAILPSLVTNWNNYMGTTATDWELREGRHAPHMGQSGDFQALMRQHRRMYLSFRRKYRHPVDMHDLLTIDLKLPVGGQDYQDIASYNRLLSGDMALLDQRREALLEPHGTKASDGVPWPREVPPEYIGHSNLWPRRLFPYPNSPDDEAIAWALDQFKGPHVLSQGHIPLLAFQVHDSLAGFYLVGFSTQEEMAEKLLKIVEQAHSKGPQSLAPYQRQVYDNYEAAIRHDPGLRDMVEDRIDTRRVLGAQATTGLEMRTVEAEFEMSSVFSMEERERAARLFPTQTDDYASTIPEGLAEKLVKAITDGRREPGGYLLERAIFEGVKP
ncbi:DUF2235 domain-containing protein [Xylophilus sp. GOD-11R]|uniref:T6SS phospholipase effector Tle1-like catalytic domain-containing protein n=1 Tax=Xylophilus sp. GOD-11R TaxID=3089814 RepID=UPI00298C5D6E|nr:DUF2235 domain-containing protein [Xylophilus sp. GOD-11R]WPB55567.1 DUF2235 domain-containing protein [Xylophilus sp. GOD-11R]